MARFHVNAAEVGAKREKKKKKKKKERVEGGGEARGGL